ncbi:MAG: rhamnose ABC transporter substrate-binding protein [Spirochaetaceae bacterium]|nr:MAG: rhamnose ABC transporter substrate-binding protein [Spirochaetaceae bacterium]
MKRLKMISLFVVLVLLAGGMVFAGGKTEAAKEGVRIAMVVKNLGNSFFEACRDGGLEAIEDLGADIELIYQGPSTPTAEGQIEIIDSLIAQKVDAIAISANDVDALVPICKKAMTAGIKVISFDSGIAPDGRILHLAPSGDEFIGRSQVRMMAELVDHEGQIAILSASSQATNQNAWIEWMKKELEEADYNNMELVTVVYGDDLSDKSYREAMGLFKSYPNLRGIISPTTVGIAATGKALEDAGKAGEIELTGLGLPSEMKQYIKNGTCRKMSLWNPIDLGYSATYIAYKLITGDVEGGAGETMDVGRMGDIIIGGGKVAVMSEPYVFDKDNIDKFAAIY